MKNIAIFGGSFDPPHIGHQIVIKEALRHLDIEKLFVVPAFLNPFKSKFYFGPEKRFEMIQKICKNISKVEVSDYEISKNSKSFTIDTVKHFKNLVNPAKIYFIIGKDNLKDLHKWHNFEELNKMVEFVVAAREGFENVEHNFKILDIQVEESSTRIRQKLQKEKYLEKRIEDIKAVLDSKKAENIEVFDVKNMGYLVDFVVIATTLNGKHGFALLDYLKEDLKPNGEEFLRVDEDDDWIVIDLGDIFIHLMSEKYREKYCIEDFLKEITKTK